MSLRSHAESIFRSALDRVEPRGMVRACCRVEGDTLSIATEEAETEIDLGSFERVWLIGAGKASVGMAAALVELLGERIAGGVVIAKRADRTSLGPVEVIEADHPIPGRRSEAAAGHLLDVARTADERSLVLNVISGGGSALLCAPWSGKHPISLGDKQQTTDALLRSGADIRELNIVRKHLSAVKGGRLAAALHPARTVSLVLSDIVGDPLDAIASGPTVPDPSSFGDALQVLERYSLPDEVPKPVLNLLRGGAAGEVPETPKPGDPSFERVENYLIGTNLHGLRAAAGRAEELGYTVVPLTARLTGEAREVAKLFTGILADIAVQSFPVAPPACIIAGGETTVTVRGNGTGGRNQELALAALAEMAREPERYARAALLSASTDGNDGPTDAAGGWADSEVLRRVSAGAIRSALADNDSYTLLNNTDALFRTGPTGTNVCDYQIALVRPA